MATFTVDGIQYTSITRSGVSGRIVEAKATSTLQNETSVTVPKTVADSRFNVYTVYRIAKNGLSACKKMITVSLPNSLVEIGQQAFISVTTLRNIDLSSTALPNLRIIESTAFNGCGLEQVSIGGQITDIRAAAFSQMPNLVGITIESSGNLVTQGNIIYGNPNLQWIRFTGNVLPNFDQATLQSDVDIICPIGKVSAYKQLWPEREDFIYSTPNCYFEDNFVRYETIAQKYGEQIVLPATNPTKEGYIFTGWSGLPADNIMPDQSLAPQATWIKAYGIQYYVNSSLYLTQWYEEGDTVVAPPDPSLDDFVFNHWTPALPGVMPANDISVNADLTRTGFTYQGFRYKYLTEVSATYRRDVEVAAESSTSLSGDVKIPDMVYDVESPSQYINVQCFIRKISADGFRGCDDITSVYIPDTINAASSGSFDDCSSLTTVYIADSSLSVMPTTFRDCSSLTEIHPASNLLEFDDDCISGNTGVTVHFSTPLQSAYNSWYVTLNNSGNTYYFYRYEPPRSDGESTGDNIIYVGAAAAQISPNYQSRYPNSDIRQLHPTEHVLITPERWYNIDTAGNLTKYTNLRLPQQDRIQCSFSGYAIGPQYKLTEARTWSGSSLDQKVPISFNVSDSFYGYMQKITLSYKLKSAASTFNGFNITPDSTSQSGDVYTAVFTPNHIQQNIQFNLPADSSQTLSIEFVSMDVEAVKTKYTFLNDDGTKLLDQFYWPYQTVVPPEVPFREHKKQSYWDPSVPTVAGTTDFVTTAVYTDFEITWMTSKGGLILKRTYEYDEVVTPPQTPSIYGYYFTGVWTPTPVERMTDGDKVYTAQYLGNPHTITWRSDGSVYQVDNVRFDDAIVTPATEPTKRFYHFDHWTPTPPATVPDNDLVFDAVFEPNTYYITYMSGSDFLLKIGYKYGLPVTSPDEQLARPGYYIDHYDPELPATMPGYDFTVQVYYELQTYYVSYFVDENLYKRIGYKYTNKIQTPVVPPKAGYLGFWDYVPATMPYNDIEVNAVYISEADAIIVDEWPVFREKLVRNTDSSIRKGNIIGDAFSRPATLASYDASGNAYYLDNIGVILTDSEETISTDYFFKETNGTVDTTVDVRLPIKTVDGSLYGGDWLAERTSNGVIYITEDAYADPSTDYYLEVEKEVERDSDGNYWQIVKNSYTNETTRGNLLHVQSQVASFSGQYDEDAYPIWQRNLFNLDDGQTYIYNYPTDQLLHRQVIIKPSGNTPYEAEFEYGDAPWPYSFYPRERLYPDYKSDMYTAIIDWYDDEDAPIQYMNFEDEKFNVLTAGSTGAGDDLITLWMYTGSSIEDVIRKSAGSSITAWPSYTREGYTFSGVSTTAGGTPITLPYTVPAQNTKLYLLWTAIPVPPQPYVQPIWTLTYMSMGSVYATVKIPDGESPAAKRPAAPSVAGYSFTGWSGEPATVTANATVTAQFTQVPTGVHTLTYKVDNQTYDTMSVKTGDVIPVAPYPVKTGYTFSGWSGFPANMIMPASALTITGSFTAK